MDTDFRIYFNTKMLDDALLKSYVTPQIVRESSAYVESVALSYGVAASSIAVPTPDIVRRLAMYYAYFTAAWRKASFSVGKNSDEDAFALKAKWLKSILDDLLDQLSAESFTGGVTSAKRKFPSTLPISRN